MSSNKQYIDHGIKWGLIMGLALGVFTNIISIVNFDLMLNPFVSYSIVIINFVVFLLLLRMIGKTARAFTGFITVNQAFTTMLVAVLVHVATTSVIYYGVEALTKEKKEARMIEIKKKMVDDMEAKGMDDEQIEKSMAMMDKFTGASSTMMILGFVLRLIIDLAIAYIIASMIKRLPPVDSIQEAETT
jgi:hypothetical protein